MLTRSPRSRGISRVLFLLSLTAVLGITACSSLPREHWWQFWRAKPAQTNNFNLPDQVEVPIPPADGGDASRNGTSLGVPPGGIVDPDPLRQPATMQSAGLRTVHFGYDSADVSPTDRATLDSNAQWLMANPTVRIQIQGHCDERGTTEYNFNLGDRRAKSVKAYLMQKGVQGDRIFTTSFGKDRPVDNGHAEESHAKNRRAQFLIY